MYCQHARTCYLGRFYLVAQMTTPIALACYRRIENIDIVPIVESELKFRQVQREVLRTDIVICANYSPLEKSPERINRLSMNFATNALLSIVVNRPMAESHFLQVVVVFRLVCRDSVTSPDTAQRTNLS
jgi:hypothetical protein